MEAKTAVALVTDNKHRLSTALGGLDVPKKLRWIQTAERLAADPEMRRCDPRSVFRSLVDVASLGLELSPHIGHAAVVRYGNVATVMVMYKGLVKLIDDRAPGAVVYADVVYQGDEFRVRSGSSPSIEHSPKLDAKRSEGVWTHVYAWVKLPSGAYYQSVMDRQEVLKVRARSRAASKAGSPWQTAETEMAKKTVLRRCMKPIPLGERAQQAEAVLAAAEEAEFAPREAEWRDVSGEQAADEALSRAEMAQAGREAHETEEPHEPAEASTGDPRAEGSDLFGQAVKGPCPTCGAGPDEDCRPDCSATPF